MIIYNITCKVDWSVHEEWLAWVQQKYMPDMLSIDLFYHGQLVRLLETDETDGPTYALQFYTHSLENYQHFMTGAGTALLRRQLDHWNNAVVSFGTVMQQVG
ncbi:MAG: DUF4286 family protein [Williamsia sp.]|nr:DUF4286 family protein [Williamsia sp.]